MITQFSAQIDSAKANNDRTLSLKIDTQELSTEDTAIIFSFFQKQIWIAIAETEVTKQHLNIPEVVEDMDKKSPSQRLRDLIFIYWKQNYTKETDFDSYYKKYLSKLCDSIRDKLN